MPKDIREQVIPKAKKLTAEQRPVYERTWPEQLKIEKDSVGRKLTKI
jgi:hypothetical protein